MKEGGGLKLTSPPPPPPQKKKEKKTTLKNPVLLGLMSTIILDECKSIVTHSIILNVNSDIVIYFDIFGDEYISKKVKNS